MDRAVRLLLLCCALAFPGAWAQAPAKPSLGAVTITGVGNLVEKSYRRMIEGMDLFEQQHALAPKAQLRFRLLPRKRGTDMDDILLEVVGNTFSYRVPIAADRTFTIPRDAKAWEEDAVVSPNRKKLSMTWRTEIRTPGLPPGTRRLGDMRLECLVGIKAGLVSNTSTAMMQRLSQLLTNPFRYCGQKNSQYLFFAERPVFAVTLVDGARRETLPIDSLYAAATDDPGLPQDLPFCDCEVMLDRTYFLPLGDKSWPDDTLVEYEYMEDRP